MSDEKNPDRIWVAERPTNYEWGLFGEGYAPKELLDAPAYLLATPARLAAEELVAALRELARCADSSGGATVRELEDAREAALAALAEAVNAE